MNHWIDFFVFGYFKISILSFCNERILALIIQSGIQLWDVSISEPNQLIAYCNCRDLNHIKKIVLEQKGYISHEAIKGFPGILKDIYHKLWFLLIGVVFITALQFLSCHIWRIDCTGNQSISRDAIIKQLSKQGIGYGTAKSKINTEKLEHFLRTEFSQIAWISVAYEGATLQIDIKEAIGEQEELEINNNSSDLISEYSGEILSIIAVEGIPLVKRNDIVNKGDVLISGELYYEDANHMHQFMKKTEGKGTVVIKTTEKFYQKVSLEYKKKIYNNNIIIYGVSSRNHGFCPFYKMFYQYIKPEHMEVIHNRYSIKPFQQEYLPVVFHKVSLKSYQMETKRYSKSEAIEQVKSELSEFLSSIRNQSGTILNSNIQYKFTPNDCIANGDIIVKYEVTK